MSAMNYGKTFKPSPPEKGSFPLDHEGECRIFTLKYMQCLSQNEKDNGKCREEAMKYFQCRMERNLMTKEEWSKLGYGDLAGKKSN